MIYKILIEYIQDKSGAIAVLAALAFPVVVGKGGYLKLAARAVWI